MKIKQVYSKYKTFQNLQEHMLRVSAVAQVILDNWTGEEINKKAIIQTCLIHDIGKPIEFDMSKQSQYVSSQKKLEEIREVHQYLIDNYGTDEHKATGKIGEEMGFGKTTLKLLNNLEWSCISKLLEKNDIESLIPIYCDMRVGPKGVLSMKERIADLQKRTQSGDTTQLIEDGINLEKLIAENTNVDLDSIVYFLSIYQNRAFTAGNEY